MKLRNHLLFAATAALLLGACTDDGEPDVGALPGHGEMLRAHFAEIDTDHDGAITIDEMKAHHEHAFAQVDSDGSGTLSRTELEDAPDPGPALAEHFDEIDADADGQLTHPEIAAFMHATP